MSDSHGNRQAIAQAVSLAGPVDLWLHAGDYSQDAEIIAAFSSTPVIAAAGNCDGRAHAKIDEFIDIAGKRIWLTHGHRHRVRQGNSELQFWARQYAVQIVVYGHTHIPDITWEQDVLILNPGSVGEPRGGHPASFGILEIAPDGMVTAKINHL